MKHPIVINSHGKIEKSLRPRVRVSLPYHAIARKALTIDLLPDGTMSIYDKDIDVSALISK